MSQSKTTLKQGRYLLFLVLLNLACLAHAQEQNCAIRIEGKVFDITTQKPLPFATVRVQEYDRGTVTEEDGSFILKNICDDEIHLEVRFLGYKTVIHHHDFHHEDPVIFLAPDETLLESIVADWRI